jgi:NAD(P)-dependent dehydrogenase (short-subunit alcohol dehydrogenase family)
MDRVAIVTGGLRGLGRAMALGLAKEGCRVCAVGHIASDVEEFMAEAAKANCADRVFGLVADLRSAAACDQVIAETEKKFGKIDILVNNAGVTFTYIDPTRFTDAGPKKFWEISDEIIQTTMDTNFVAADRLGRRLAPKMIAQGWGRIVNVTTKLDTMNRPGSSPYGPSKAALEMATEIWAKGVEGTGVAVCIVNPGAGANTLGMAQEMRDWSRDGKVAKLVEADEMVPPLLWVINSPTERVNGKRYDALTWLPDIPPEESAEKTERDVGFRLYPTRDEA